MIHLLSCLDWMRIVQTEIEPEKRNMGILWRRGWSQDRATVLIGFYSLNDTGLVKSEMCGS